MDRNTAATRRRVALGRRRRRMRQAVATALLGSAFTQAGAARRRDEL
ncbi:MAG: hypothetical protein NTV28_00110 [Propionibacteriales bacterium]|nr:hypothetical protein [Propionibacteriales bacterium]